ncbi:Ethionine resistance-conferring protein 1 [Spathaspora sp. JA1]|nr:Ethionine resistance-conferring protein 1 [Spathaspora sp. JA1]
MTSPEPTEDTLLLGERLASISSQDSEEVLSYIQQHRISITNKSPVNLTHPHESSRLSSSISISDVISMHTNELEPEPTTTLVEEFKILVSYSFPMIITFLLQYSLTVASVFSVGRIGGTELAAVSLSTMSANITGYAIIQGVSTCLDTLCAQAYGRKDYNAVGVHFIRCNYLLMLLFIPIFGLWVWGVEPTLLFLIDEPESRDMCLLAAKYLRILAYGLPGFILFENAKHFLQSQGVFHASTYVLMICAPINAILNYLLVWDKNIGLGFVGAPLSVVITNWLMFILLYLYIYLECNTCWPKQPLYHPVFITNWNKMISLAIPGVLMVEAEWLAWEIITFEAAKFGTKVLAAQSIITTTCILIYQIPFALGIATSTRVAWFIGAASKSAAIIATRASIITALVLGIVNEIELASTVLIIGAIYQINDFLSCCTAGVLRGQGRQMIGGILNLVGYYLIALPSAYVFAFIIDLKLLGLWFGMIIALAFVSFTQLYFVFISQWDDIIDKCVNEGVEEGHLNIESHSLLPSMSNSSTII